jgi:hypothetical protein
MMQTKDKVKAWNIIGPERTPTIRLYFALWGSCKTAKVVNPLSFYYKSINEYVAIIKRNDKKPIIRLKYKLKISFRQYAYH